MTKTAESDPIQRLLLATWFQALKDINRGFLLECGIIEFDEGSEKSAEIKENFDDALEWVTLADGTFPVVAWAMDMSTEELHDKTLEIIAASREKIKNRKKITNEYIYATVSRFRDYNQAFEEKFKDALSESKLVTLV